MDVTANDLIFAADVARWGGNARALRTSRALTRVRRGVYCERALWETIGSRQRHLLRILATAPALRSAGLFAGVSAAALWNIPIEHEWPDEVTLLAPYRGGGKSEPGVRRTSVAAKGAVRATVMGVATTTLARTAVDLARSSTFGAGLASVDAVVRMTGADFLDTLLAELERMDLRTGRAQAQRVIGAASPLSESFGESMARAAMLELGFEPPELQVEFRDEKGSMYPDFFWPSVDVAAEFDGKSKYTREEFTGGDPGEVVWREKLREDRLRKKVRRLIRITSGDVARPAVLAAELDRAGVPRL